MNKLQHILTLVSIILISNIIFFSILSYKINKVESLQKDTLFVIWNPNIEAIWWNNAASIYTKLDWLDNSFSDLWRNWIDPLKEEILPKEETIDIAERISEYDTSYCDIIDHTEDSIANWLQWHCFWSDEPITFDDLNDLYYVKCEWNLVYAVQRSTNLEMYWIPVVELWLELLDNWQYKLLDYWYWFKEADYIMHKCQKLGYF